LTAMADSNGDPNKGARHELAGRVGR
jgi:hypothetical protein